MEQKLDLSGIDATIKKVKNDIGEVRNIGSKEVGESPEEKAQKEQETNEKVQEEAKKKARLAVVKTFQTQLLQIKAELAQNKTIDDILTEINEKKSRMSRTTRDFCLNFEKDAILGLVKDLDSLQHGKIKI
jgi:anaerobic ribonucleoside-triphosphate reductase